MKKLLILAVILSLTAVACDAFKDNYDGQPVEVTAPGGGLPNTAPAAGDYADDKTVCTAVADVAVTKAEEAGVVTSTVLSTAADGSKLSTKAEKIGTFTTWIGVMEAEKVLLSFTLKQTGEKEFSVCSVTADGLVIKSGSLTVDSFNLVDKEDAEKVVNAGSFKFDFAKAESTAVKIMQELAGDSSGLTSMEGTYYTDALIDQVIEVDGGEKK